MGYISKQIYFGDIIIINENIHTVICNIMILQHIVIKNYVLEVEKTLTNGLTRVTILNLS